MATRRKIPLRLRREIVSRAQGRCEYCQSPEHFSLDTFAIDHIQPLSLGGSDALENLAFACQNCNNRKQDSVSALDPVTGTSVPLFHPRRDSWKNHFQWSGDALTIEPKTAIGRATLSRL